MNISVHDGSGAGPVQSGDVAGQAALEQQLRELSGLQQLFEEALAMVPDPRAEGVWSGPAHNAYVAALAKLADRLGVAGSQLEAAIADTRRAVATIAGR